MFKIIGITGLKHHGKDTAARYFEGMGYENVKFADSLKDMMRALLLSQGCLPSIAERMINGDLKNEPSPYLQMATCRRAMQTLGTEWGREIIGTEIWVRSTMNKVQSIREGGHPGAVITDARFFNEEQAIHKAGGYLIRVVRQELLQNGLKDLHPSEASVMHLPVDAEVTNDGSIDDLLLKMRDIHREIP